MKFRGRQLLLKLLSKRREDPFNFVVNALGIPGLEEIRKPQFINYVNTHYGRTDLGGLLDEGTFDTTIWHLNNAKNAAATLEM